jgi:hypothetical protein
MCQLGGGGCDSLGSAPTHVQFRNWFLSNTCAEVAVDRGVASRLRGVAAREAGRLRGAFNTLVNSGACCCGGGGSSGGGASGSLRQAESSCRAR